MKENIIYLKDFITEVDDISSNTHKVLCFENGFDFYIDDHFNYFVKHNGTKGNNLLSFLKGKKDFFKSYDQLIGDNIKYAKKMMPYYENPEVFIETIFNYIERDILNENDLLELFVALKLERKNVKNSEKLLFALLCYFNKNINREDSALSTETLNLHLSNSLKINLCQGLLHFWINYLKDNKIEKYENKVFNFLSNNIVDIHMEKASAYFDIETLYKTFFRPSKLQRNFKNVTLPWLIENRYYLCSNSLLTVHLYLTHLKVTPIQFVFGLKSEKIKSFETALKGFDDYTYNEYLKSLEMGLLNHFLHNSYIVIPDDACFKWLREKFERAKKHVPTPTFEEYIKLIYLRYKSSEGYVERNTKKYTYEIFLKLNYFLISLSDDAEFKELYS